MIRKRPSDGSLNRNQRSSATFWSQCTNLRSLKQIHASLITKGFNSNPSALRELIFQAAVGMSGGLSYAHELFDRISHPDNFMWNTIIRGSAQSQNPLNAVLRYTQMAKCGVEPDNFTFPFVLKACTKLCWRKMGFGIQGKALKMGFIGNSFLRNTLIYFHANCGDLSVASELFDASAKRDVVPWSALTSGYAKRGELDVARRYFDEMPVKDLVSWNVMITGYVKRGEMDSARKLFNEVPKKDVVTWNAMIAGYVICGECEKALKMFEEMKNAGERPDEVTMLSLLNACADLGDLQVGTRIHWSLSEMGSRNFNVLLGNALVDMYAKCGSIERALEVFREMREKDVSTWNSVIGGLAFHGHAEESIKLFTEMQRSKVRPNEITFVGVFVACSHAGKVNEGHQYFKLMRDGYNIEPNIRHYGCMVDMLGRAGQLDEAFKLIDSMEIEPNAIIWRTLLGACRIHGNVELGRRANERLLKMRREQSGDYVLLSNIYASKGEWDGVEKVRKMMDDSGVTKEPGCSLLEAEEKALMHFLFDSKSKINLRPKNLVP
ncbi:PREDICTED: pentatricopeptide repeat-containing protein At5g15300 [Theobroma cacao]|uniref:Pentatricopeptide repeat-containing protein At5g15300 n=1 Tax=Theobroma cacao TaxID=3641 RepID=A0AB32W4J1_THECC|nr:PREDICTED: pentatricopeptide repeat-containing protein At5g15300 [Theobroma cacao]